MSVTRALSLSIVAYLALLLCSALPVILPGHARIPMPDVVLLTALHAALTCRFSGPISIATRDGGPAAMAAFGLILGYLSDLISGAPRGLHALALCLLVLGVRSMATQLLVRGAAFVMTVAALGQLSYSLLVLALRGYVAPEVGWAGLGAVPAQVAATALCAPPMFALLRRLDARLWPQGRTQGLSL